MKTKLFLTTLVMAFLVSGITGFAQDFDRDCQFDGPRKGLPAIPDLSADQMKSMQKLRLEHQKEVLPLRTKLQSGRLDLKTLIMEEASQKQIDRKIEEIGSFRTELMKLKVAHRMEIRNLLTDEQKVFFDMPRKGRRGAGGRDHHFQGPRGMRGKQGLRK
ncbi:MAG: periplasmic heavy metal sensor [candidate division KSB1 bacterium]|jgi:Spy/CpxP family protein refolding chaperone|nr:periplasmic heavy metal sensor [candidate division KSB1 bacterium]